MKAPRQGPRVLVNSDGKWNVLNVKQGRYEQLMSGLIVDICTGKAALRRSTGAVGMAARQHAILRGILEGAQFCSRTDGNKGKPLTKLAYRRTYRMRTACSQ